MGQGNPTHKYRQGGELTENFPDEKNLEMLVDEKLDVSQMCTCNPESLTRPGLSQKQLGQEVIPPLSNL